MLMPSKGKSLVVLVAVTLLMSTLHTEARALIIHPDKVILTTICENGKKTTKREIVTGGWEITGGQIIGVAIGGLIIKIIFDPPLMNDPLFSDISPPTGWSYETSTDGQMLKFRSPTTITDPLLVPSFSFSSPVPFGYLDAGLMDTGENIIEKIWWDEPAPDINPYPDVLLSVVGTPDANQNQFFVYNDGNTPLTNVTLDYIEAGTPQVLNLPDLGMGQSYKSAAFDGSSVTYASLTTNETYPTTLSGSSGIPTYSCGNPIPEPASLIVWSVLGSLGISVGWWRRRRKGV